MKTKGILLAALLGTCCNLASAAVQVSFVDIAKYRDAVPDTWHGQARETDTTLKELRKHIEKLAERSIPADQTLRVYILDIDLAGEIKRLGSTLREIRVLNDISWPMLKLRYEVEKDGRIEAQGEATLTDPNYLEAINSYPSSDPLRHERRMLDGWFAHTFPKH